MPLNLLLIDIETVPIVKNFSQLDNNWQKLWLDKQEKYINQEGLLPEESWEQRGGILSEFAKIICISTAFFYKKNDELFLKTKSICGDDEKEILTQFLQIANKVKQHNPQFLFAGHNIKEFDIPFICRRLLINQMPLPNYLQLHNKKPWEVQMLDTLALWKFGDHKHYTSLHLLATVLGIPSSKDIMNGSEVQYYYYEKKDLTKIAQYCQQDVVVTANIILRFNNLPLLPADHIIEG